MYNQMLRSGDFSVCPLVWSAGRSHSQSEMVSDLCAQGGNSTLMFGFGLLERIEMVF